MGIISLLVLSLLVMGVLVVGVRLVTRPNDRKGPARTTNRPQICPSCNAATLEDVDACQECGLKLG